MAKPTNWACWAWVEEGAVRYIGVGPYGKTHPALERWFARFEDESPLNLWLQGYIEEPERQICGSPIMPRDMARDLAAIYRARNAATILTARDHSGGGLSRRVAYVPDIIEDFTIFESVRKAAEWAGINASTVTRRCQSAKSPEWLYVEGDSI